MSGRRPILMAFLLGALVALVGLSLTTTGDDWEDDPVAESVTLSW
jgi:hypothetical protein